MDREEMVFLQSCIVLGLLVSLPYAWGAQRKAAPTNDFITCSRSLVNPDDAIPACSRLLAPGRTDIQIYEIRNNRGIAYFRLQRYKDAIDDFTAAAQHNPRYVDAYRNRGRAWHVTGDFDRAIDDFNYAIRLAPDNPALYNQRGAALHSKGEFGRAIRDFDEALRRDPRHVNALVNRGLALQHERQLDRAIADFNQVIALDPRNTNALNNRGLALMDKGNFDDAIKDYDAAIRVDPKGWQAFSNRGEAWRLKGNIERALADHNQAIKLDPTAADAYNNRAVTWREKGDLDRALADCDEAILINPRHDLAYVNRGEFWRLKGNLDRSLDELNKALELNPNSPVALAYRGETLRRLGKLPSALDDFNKAVRILPDAVIAFTGRGLTHEDMGKARSAIADFQKALQLSPDFDGSLGREAQARARERLVALQVEVDPIVLVERGPKDEPQSGIGAAEGSNTGKGLDSSKAENPRPATLPPTLGRRVALVIGNSSYQGVPALPNTLGAAEAVAGVLRQVGFQSVVVQRDLTRDKLIAALDAFRVEVATADWAVIFYSGHGIDLGGVNYLVPVDANLKADSDIEGEAVSLSRLLTSAKRAKRLRLVILDASRENSFVPQMRRTLATLPVGRGLATIETAGGTMVVYAADEGQVAKDVDEGQGPFVSALLKHLPVPNVDISTLFRRVRNDVMAATGQRQSPFVYNPIVDQGLYFTTNTNPPNH